MLQPRIVAFPAIPRGLVEFLSCSRARPLRARRNGANSQRLHCRTDHYHTCRGDLTRLSDDVYGGPAKARHNPINTTSILAAGRVRCIALYTVRPFPEGAPAYDLHAPSPCDRLGFHRWGPRMTICGQGRKAGNQGSSIASNPLNGRMDAAVMDVMDAAVLDASVDLVERGGLYST